MSVLERLEVVQGDITRLEVEAIVNAANETLLGGGGVDGAIHRAAGPELLSECRALGGCTTGEARITAGYRLPAAHVIHTVGPVYRDGIHGEPDKLRSCYRESLGLAARQGCSSVAFPAISCGVYGYPIEAAARIACHTVWDFLQDHDCPQRVVFVLFDQRAFDTYERVLAELQASHPGRVRGGGA